MGTLSLVFGLIILFAGIIYLYQGLFAGAFLATGPVLYAVLFSTPGIVMIVIGAKLIQKYDRDKKTNKLLDEREGIKTPKVAEARKCPTCNQESHDKIGDHYKCLNPDCEIDTFQA